MTFASKDAGGKVVGAVQHAALSLSRQGGTYLKGLKITWLLGTFTALITDAITKEFCHLDKGR